MTHPPFHITKEHFVGVINALHQQYLKDKANSEAFSQVFSAPDCGFYDNSLLINSVFSFLHSVFPKDDEGHCEIEFYCYSQNFGKVGEEYESPEQLFHRLIDAQVPANASRTIIVREPFYVPEDFDLEKWVEAIKTPFKGNSSPYLVDEAGHFPCTWSKEPCDKESTSSTGIFSTVEGPVLDAKRMKEYPLSPEETFLQDDVGQFTPKESIEYFIPKTPGITSSPDETA